MLIPCAIGTHAATSSEGVAVLVDVDRDGRRRLQLRAVRRPGRERLLAVLDAELAELRQRVERLVERPPLVDVDLEGDVGRLPDGAHPIDIETVAASELQLQAPEPPARVRLRRLRPHLVGRGEPDRPGGRRPEPLEPEHSPDRLAEKLPTEVVQRCVDRGPRGELVVGQALHHVVQGERVVAEVARDALHERERRLGRLVIPLDRRSLTEPGDVPVPDLDLDHLRRVLRPARDRERLGELQGDDPGAELHAQTFAQGTVPGSDPFGVRPSESAAATLSSSRASSSGDRARASGARGRRFDSCLAQTDPRSQAESAWLRGSDVSGMPRMLAACRPRCRPRWRAPRERRFRTPPKGVGAHDRSRKVGGPPRLAASPLSRGQPNRARPFTHPSPLLSFFGGADMSTLRTGARGLRVWCALAVELSPAAIWAERDRLAVVVEVGAPAIGVAGEAQRRASPHYRAQAIVTTTFRLPSPAGEVNGTVGGIVPKKLSRIETRNGFVPAVVAWFSSE